ncbi:hypothetical protein RB595_004853 [Gaeumannomyces hyphopodioides]
MWLREVRIHSKVSSGKHPIIVQLLGVDARVHSFYLEAVQAPALDNRVWRRADSYFASTAAHATRVLRDSGVIHNDIKLGNILFSDSRGAVLINFGLSTDNPNDRQALWVLGRERELEATEELMASIRLWNHRFDARSEEFLPR